MDIYLIACVGGLVGMLAHFLKLRIREQSLASVLNYFVENFKDTLLALISTVCASFLVVYILTPEAPLLAIFLTAASTGYNSDSFWNTGAERAGKSVL